MDARPLTGRTRRHHALPELAAPALLYAGSRLATWLAAFPLMYVDTKGHDRALFTGWEGHTLIRLADRGYTGRDGEAYLPGYPLAVDGVASLTGWSAATAAVVVTVAAGLVACCAVYGVARALGGRRPAVRASALFAFLPGAYILSMAYPDALFVAPAAVCLWALLRRRWVLAGVAAAAAGFVDPRAIALIGVCGWESVRVAWRERTPVPLSALALSPIGVEAAYIRLHSEPGVFAEAVQATWSHLLDLAVRFPGEVGDWIGDPTGAMGPALGLLAMVLMVGGLVLLVRSKAPSVVVLYTVVMALAAFTLLDGSGALRGMVAAFPLCVGYGLAVNEDVHPGVIASCGALMIALLSMTYLTTAYLP